MVTFDPESQQYVEVPDRLRIPFLNQEIGAGDVIAGITQALGVTPCTVMSRGALLPLNF